MAWPVIAGTKAAQVGAEISKWAAVFIADRALDAMLTPGPVYVDDQQEIPFPERTTPEIVNNITISVDPTFQQTHAQDTQLALNELAKRDDGAELIEARAALLQAVSNPVRDNDLNNTTDAQRRAMGIAGLPNNVSKLPLDPLAKAAVRKIGRKDVDGYYVSKEEHEYRYCRNSGAIAQVYELAEETPLKPDSFGAFVDSVLMRKAIAQIRKLRRLTHGKNAKALTALLGTTRDDLLIDLVQQSTPISAQMAAAVADYESKKP